MNDRQIEMTQRLIDELRFIEKSATPSVVRSDRQLLEKVEGSAAGLRSGHVLASFTGVNTDANADAIVWLLNNASKVREALELGINGELAIRAALA